MTTAPPQPDAAIRPDAAQAEKCRLIGLHLGIQAWHTDDRWINYDLGRIAVYALEALSVAVLAVEQIVTGERLVGSLDVGDFYRNLNQALEEENGQGVVSESGSMSSIQDEIQGLKDLVGKARRIAKRPRGSK